MMRKHRNSQPGSVGYDIICHVRQLMLAMEHGNDPSIPSQYSSSSQNHKLSEHINIKANTINHNHWGGDRRVSIKSFHYNHPEGDHQG